MFAVGIFLSVILRTTETGLVISAFSSPDAPNDGSDGLLVDAGKFVRRLFLSFSVKRAGIKAAPT
jgi:hypothetical protein